MRRWAQVGKLAPAKGRGERDAAFAAVAADTPARGSVAATTGMIMSFLYMFLILFAKLLLFLQKQIQL